MYLNKAVNKAGIHRYKGLGRRNDIYTGNKGHAAPRAQATIHTETQHEQANTTHALSRLHLAQEACRLTATHADVSSAQPG